MTSPRGNHLSLGKWLLLNLKVGALSFGSSARTVIYKDELTRRDRQTLTAETFNQAVTTSQVLPGPNLVNLAAFLGYQLTTPMGALLGILSLALPGSLFIVFMAMVVPWERPEAQWLFQGFSIGSAAVFTSFIADLGRPLIPRLLIPKGNYSLSRSVGEMKQWLRGLLIVAVATGVLAGVSAAQLIIIGGSLGLVIEFRVARDKHE